MNQTDLKPTVATSESRSTKEVKTAEGTPTSVNENSQIRPEYAQQMKDFEQLLDGTKEKALDYYKMCGNPQNISITKYAMPEDIIKELGPIANAPADNDECLRNI